MTDRKTRTLLIVRHEHSERRVLFGLRELAARSGVHTAFVERLLRLGVIEHAPGHPRMFAPETTVRVRAIIRLEEELGINAQGAAVVLDLLARIRELEERLR